MSATARWIAVDIGGTFTDLAAMTNADTFITAKTLTTPQDHAEGVINGLDKLGARMPEVELFLHGSTIAINTVLQRSGATTALLTTRGFRDVYEIGRGNRSDAYNLFFERPAPLVPRRLRYEIDERVLAGGQVHRELDLDQARAVILSLRDSGVQSVAICLLHSYANPDHELALGRLVEQLCPGVYVSLSHQVLREYREYERTSTTVLNAYVGPVVSRYLDSLTNRLARRGFTGRLLIMQSNGGVMPVESARANPVRMMESGPVAGVVGVAALAEPLGASRLISFDMGGTTAKTSLIRDGQTELSHGYFIGGYGAGQPMALPVVDIVEVGAGGGSIAWVDQAGALKVGPVSAGAVPGPACYGLGGERPTVTDANLVLGRLGAAGFLGGEMPLDVQASERAIMTQVAEPLGLDLRTAARGIVAVADAQMSLAVRAVSVGRGEDPREAVLVATGGAGPLHAAAIARELNIATVVVPRLPGQFSAKGMLATRVRYDLTQTHLAAFVPETIGNFADIAKGLAVEVTERLRVDIGELAAAAAVSHVVDIRYRGQEFTISVPVTEDELSPQSYDLVRGRFDELHKTLYGHHAPGEAVEAVGVRTTVTVDPHVSVPSADSPADLRSARGQPDLPEPIETRRVVPYGAQEPVVCPVYQRHALLPGHHVVGPAIVQESTSSSVLHPGDLLDVAADGSLVISVGGSR